MSDMLFEEYACIRWRIFASRAKIAIVLFL